MAKGKSTYYWPSEAGYYNVGTYTRVVIVDNWDEDSNTSSYTANLQIKTIYYGQWTPHGSVYVDGYALVNSSIYVSGGGSSTDWKTVAATVRRDNLSHDENGNLSVSISVNAASGYSRFALTNNKTTSVNCGLVPGSYTVALHKNLLASTISSITDKLDTGDLFSITVEKMNPDYRHDLKFSVGDTVLHTTGVFDEGTELTVPRSWFDNIPETAVLTVTAALTTYKDETREEQVGLPVETEITVTADAGMVPSISSCVLSADNAAAGVTWTEYIQGYSKVKATVSASTFAPATITGYQLTVEGVTTEGIHSSNNVTKAGNVDVTLTAIDTRGRTASVTQSITVQAYSNPFITDTYVKRCRDDGTLDDDGTCLKIRMVAAASSVNGQNVPVLTCKIVGDGNTKSYTMSSGVEQVVENFNPDSGYTLTYKIVDMLGNSASREVQLPTRIWAMQFHETGLGVAFGKACEIEKALQVPENWKFYRGTEELLPMTEDGVMSIVKTGIAAGDLGMIKLKYGTHYFNESDPLPPAVEGQLIFVKKE